MIRLPMKIGSAEWFKQLKDRVTFPGYFAFYYAVGNNKEISILAKKVDTSSKRKNNIPIKALQPTLSMALSANNIALIDVYMIENQEVYFESIKALAHTWGVEIQVEN